MNEPRLSILVVDDERAVREVVADLLQELGHQVDQAGDGEEALRKLDEQDFQLVLSDVRMPRLDGLRLLDAVIDRHPGTRILLFTGYGSIEDAVAAIKRGALGYLTKPINFPQLIDEITKLARDLNLSSSGAQLMNEMLRRHGQGLPLSRNRRMNNLVQLTVSRIADSPASVLITGESGTGKELMAALIHRFSPRRDGPFVKVSAAAIPESLLESELFGHVKGAFTGAVRDRRGRVAEADGGTLFLDEIGEIRPALQAKLLRVLQEREFQPVGSSRTCSVDLRLITATNRDLPQEIAAGRFRPDLYYRLNVLDIHLPPLRERREDLPELIDFILQRLSRRVGRPAPCPSAAFLARLAELEWPGNIRELENLLERCLLLSRDAELDLIHLPQEYQLSLRPGRPAFGVLGSLASLAQLTLDEAREHFEHELLLQVLEEERGNVSACSRRLGIARKNLQIKLKRLGIDPLLYRRERDPASLQSSS